jgi:hypothetical protein
MHTAARSISGLDFQVALPAPLRRGFLLCRGYAFFLLLGGDAHHVMSIRLSGPRDLVRHCRVREDRLALRSPRSL